MTSSYCSSLSAAEKVPCLGQMWRTNPRGRMGQEGMAEMSDVQHSWKQEKLELQNWGAISDSQHCTRKNSFSLCWAHKDVKEVCLTGLQLPFFSFVNPLICTDRHPDVSRRFAHLRSMKHAVDPGLSSALVFHFSGQKSCTRNSLKHTPYFNKPVNL